MRARKIIFSLCCVGLLSACASATVDGLRKEAFSIAGQAGFQPLKLQSSFFGLSGFFKQGVNSDAPVVYIEGDGFAWIDRYTVSRNPTPRNPLALKLATQDTSPTVFYLARPCQYVDLGKEPNCHHAYWTQARFAKEVIEAFDQALTHIKKETKSKGFHLVGFSGGGAVATLLASQRTDIHSVRTIAGNLDHVSLNRHQNVSPLTGSLNPMNSVQDIQHIPQIHYAGSEDTVVPQWVAANFVHASQNPACVKTYVISGAEHISGWQQVWGRLHRQIPEC